MPHEPDPDRLDDWRGERAGLLWPGRGTGLDVDGRERGTADFEEVAAVQIVHDPRILTSGGSRILQSSLEDQD